MNITIQENEEFTLARVDGPLDDDATHIFRQHLHPLIEENARIVLELSNCPRVNSEALSALVKLKADANMKGARLILAALTPFVDEVIRITQLNSFFDVSETLDEAVSRISR